MKKIFIITILFITNLALAVDIFNTFQYSDQKQYQKPWFEWWYYKVNDPITNESFYFVYGVVNPWDHENLIASSRAYVGAGDFKNKDIYESIFQTNQFYASKEETFVKIEHNQATDKNFFGSIEDNKLGQISWDINIEKKWSYNPVSWALGKNITDIEWYPAQASAVCNGVIQTKSRTINLKNAPCYQDRNWGSRFPNWWTWIVSNYFIEDKESVLVIGGGRPTYKKVKFPIEGVSIGLKHKNVEYFFRPTDLDLTFSKIQMGQWEAIGNNGKYIIEIKATSKFQDFLDLKFLTPQNEVFHDYETLNGTLNIKLFKNIRPFKKLLFELNSNHAGIEFGSTKTFDCKDTNICNSLNFIN